MNFPDLLISTCDILEESFSEEGYEQVKEWNNKLTDVPTRKDSDNTARIQDEKIRINEDDDLFFFEADIDVVRGNRIVFNEENYDVIKVNEVYDDESIHHKEVRARLTDNQ